MKKKTKKRLDNTTKAKKRIQKLLTIIVRLRDQGCIFRDFSVGKCGGYTSADHIITRGRSELYADLSNVVCVCNYHHIWWKPTNPTIYTRIVKEYIGKGALEELHIRERIINQTYGLKHWQNKERKLQKHLESFK